MSPNSPDIAVKTAILPQPTSSINPDITDFISIAEHALLPFKNDQDEYNQHILLSAEKAFKCANNAYESKNSRQIIKNKSKIFIHLIQSLRGTALAPEIRAKIKDVINALNKENAFTNLKLKNVNLRRATMCNLNLSGTTMINVDLSYVIAPGLNISDSNLQNVKFSGAVLDRSTFNSTHMTQVNMYNASFQHAQMNAVKATELNLRQTNFTHTTFIDTEITFSNFHQAIFANVNFHSGLVMYCTFASTDFTQTEFKGATLLCNLPTITSLQANQENRKVSSVYSAHTQKNSFDLNSPVMIGNQNNSQQANATNPEQEYDNFYQNAWNKKELKEGKRN